jgi:hypothetical protein
VAADRILEIGFDGVLVVRMMASIDGKHFDPDSSEILLRSPKWVKSLGPVQ